MWTPKPARSSAMSGRPAGPLDWTWAKPRLSCGGKKTSATSTMPRRSSSTAIAIASSKKNSTMPYAAPGRIPTRHCRRATLTWTETSASRGAGGRARHHGSQSRIAVPGCHSRPGCHRRPACHSPLATNTPGTPHAGACRGGRAICSGSKAGAERPGNSPAPQARWQSLRPAPGKRRGAAPKAGVPNAQRRALGWAAALGPAPSN